MIFFFWRRLLFYLLKVFVIHNSRLVFLGFQIPQEATCKDALGMQYNLIPDSAITASSTLVPTTLLYAPRNARLHYRGGVGRLGGWIPEVNDQHQWLQINFGRETQVTGIATQGFYNALHYVKSYTLQYFDDRGFLQQYQTESRTTVNICMGNDFLKG